MGLIRFLQVYCFNQRSGERWYFFTQNFFFKNRSVTCDKTRFKKPLSIVKKMQNEALWAGMSQDLYDWQRQPSS